MSYLNPDEITNMFNRISRTYDSVNRLLSFGLDARWRRSLIKHLPAKSHLNWLDLATGTGEQIAALLQMKAPIVTAVGVDMAEEMLKIARKKLSSASETVKFIQADALSLPFEDQFFDVCSFSFGIRNVSNPQQALIEMHRVTQNGGRCLILEFAIPQNCFRPVHLFYLRHIIPLIGQMLSSDHCAYRYLNQSIESFAKPNQFLKWMQQTGWKNVSVKRLCFGSVMLYQGDK